MRNINHNTRVSHHIDCEGGGSDEAISTLILPFQNLKVSLRAGTECCRGDKEQRKVGARLVSAGCFYRPYMNKFGGVLENKTR